MRETKKPSRRRPHLLPSVAKSLVCEAVARSVSTMTVGNLKTSEKAKTWATAGTNRSSNGHSTGIVKMLT